MKRCMMLMAVMGFLLCSCKNHRNGFLSGNKEKSIIGIQIMGGFKKEQVSFISEEISHFYNRPVVVFPAKAIPTQFLNTEKGERYNADSIILLLSKLKNDSITEIVGFTDKDIYTTVKDKEGKTREPAYKYQVWGIFGLGYQPGHSCIISVYRLATKDSSVFYHRLRTVVLHEIGHNAGLPHCAVARCIMSDANEKISTVDNSGSDYCNECKKKLEQ